MISNHGRFLELPSQGACKHNASRATEKLFFLRSKSKFLYSGAPHGGPKDSTLKKNLFSKFARGSKLEFPNCCPSSQKAQHDPELARIQDPDPESPVKVSNEPHNRINQRSRKRCSHELPRHLRNGQRHRRNKDAGSM